MSDCPQFAPLVDAVRANLGRKPREFSADTGYCMQAEWALICTAHNITKLTKAI
jgi:hypothetical protein